MKAVRHLAGLTRWPSATITRSYSVHASSNIDRPVQTIAALRTLARSEPDIEVCGWVRSVRKSPGVRFIDVTDGSSMRPIQAVVDKDLAAGIHPGAAVRLKGSWNLEEGQGGMRDAHMSPQVSDSTAGMQGGVSNPPLPGDPASNAEKESLTDSLAQMPIGGVDTPDARERAASQPEFKVSEAEILGTSDPKTYPIQNKYQTSESLRSIPHLRSRTPLNSTLLRLRSDAMAVLTEFFFQRDFRQTHPPIITSSDCEGAGEAFMVTADGDAAFFKQQKYLTVSSQLHLEAMAQALGNVWALSPTFRAEQSDTSRHLSEFYMLEVEMSFTNDMDEVMTLGQDMLKHLAGRLTDLRAAQELRANRLDAREPAEKLAFEDLDDAQELRRRWRGLESKDPWPRITYTDAIGMLQSADVQFENEPTWGASLQSEHEKYLAQKVGWNPDKDAYLPVYIIEYPMDTKAFYMRRSAACSDEKPTVDCFDLIVPTIGELAGGSMREHRLGELEDNMRRHGLEVPRKRNAQDNVMSWYLDLRRWGCPPHGGFGIGFDRLLSYLTGVRSIRDVVPFPRHYGRCDC